MKAVQNGINDEVFTEKIKVESNQGLGNDSQYKSTSSRTPVRGCHGSINQKDQYRHHRFCFCSVLSTCFPIEHQQRKKERSKRRKIIHFELLKDVPFLILCACMVFFNLANKTVFTFLPVLGSSRGLANTEASLLISATGVGDTFGRLTAGFIMDQPWVVPEIFYGSVLFVCAGVSVLITYVDSFVQFCLAGALYGCFAGVSTSQKPTLLTEILGRELFTTSFGILYCFQGLGTISGPPISGALKDSLGSYNYAFYLTASCLSLSGILFIISCTLFKLKSRKQARDAGSGESSQTLLSRTASFSKEASDPDVIEPEKKSRP